MDAGVSVLNTDAYSMLCVCVCVCVWITYRGVLGGVYLRVRYGW